MIAPGRATASIISCSAVWRKWVSSRRRRPIVMRYCDGSASTCAEFEKDTSLDAYEKAVDRLLNDVRFGERWARPWLDLARYADSAGYGSDPLRTIWRYRDWVIGAFHRNLPYARVN